MSIFGGLDGSSMQKAETLASQRVRAMRRCLRGSENVWVVAVSECD